MSHHSDESAGKCGSDGCIRPRAPEAVIDWKYPNCRFWWPLSAPESDCGGKYTHHIHAVIQSHHDLLDRGCDGRFCLVGVWPTDDSGHLWSWKLKADLSEQTIGSFQAREEQILLRIVRPS